MQFLRSREFQKDAHAGKEVNTLTPADIEIADGTVKIDKDRFNFRDVIVASINNDTVKGDGVGGSALFKTREFLTNGRMIQKVYKATFNEEAAVKMNDIGREIVDAGVRSK